MCVLLTYFLIGCFFGSAVTREADIDINRFKAVSNEVYPEHSHPPRPIPYTYYYYKGNNDYDNYSRRFVKPRATIQSAYDAPAVPSPQTLKVYQPREDPKLFYQSDAYIQENIRKNIESEVSSVYPGFEVIRAEEKYYRPKWVSMRSHRRTKRINKKLCLSCPEDMTLVASRSRGTQRTLVPVPRLKTCSGASPPKNVKFTVLHGPKVGSLIGPGNYKIIGDIAYNNKIMKTCKLQVNVVPMCVIPKYLHSDCDYTGRCKFLCQNPQFKLEGPSTLICRTHTYPGYGTRSNMSTWVGWSGRLPVCSTPANITKQ